MSTVQAIVLEKGEYLTDKEIFILKNKLTLIQAGTGVGKTTLIMEKLAKEYDIVVMLVPSVLKVEELEAFYQKKLGGIRYHFFYDKHVPSDTTFIKGYKYVVVCTYEKLDKVRECLPKEFDGKTLLVVDECHKLSSAGSYRDESLNYILYTLQKKDFSTVVFLTATFTPHCWNTLKIPLDTIYRVTSENSLDRNIEVKVLKKGDQHSFVHLVMERFEAMKNEGKRGKILIRLNNRKKCELYADLFEKLFKLKVLVVHSKNKHEDAVKTMFKQQEIPKDVDIVLCTSIMDEAINLNNVQDDIDSVFVLGKDAHPEELVQFLGRLRKATVPCFIVLHTKISMDTTILPHKLHEIYLKKNTEFLERVDKAAELLIGVFADYQHIVGDDEGGHSSSSLYQKVNAMNETFNYFCGAKLFAVVRGKLQKNLASVSSGYYRTDKACCYHNFMYLEYRLQQLLPTCTVKLREDHTLQTDQSILSFLGETKKTNEQMYQESIDTAMEIFLSVEPSQSDCKTKEEDLESRQITVSEDDEDTDYYDDDTGEEALPATAVSQKDDEQKSEAITLKNYGVAILREQQEDEFYVQRLVAKYVVPHPKVTAELVSTIALLSTYMGNLEDIYQILKRKESEKVITIAKAYANNIVVQYFVNRFYRYGSERYFNAHKLSPVDAATLLTEAFTAVQQKTHIPMRTFIDQKLVSGIKLDMKTHKMVIDPSKAANFFVRFFAAKDRNAKKPDLRYLEFHGIVFGNYQYLATAKLQEKTKTVSAQFTVGERIFDSMTGACLSDVPCPLVRSRLVIEEDEFFDDAA